MFDWVLNTPLTDNGRKSKWLKKNLKVMAFTLETSGKVFLLYSETYLEPSRKSTMESFCKNS